MTLRNRKIAELNIPTLRRLRRFTLLILCCLVFGAFANSGRKAYAQTANGEIENRPSPTFRRVCMGGTNAGNYCKDNPGCPGSTCADRNVFNITVAVLYDAPASDITAIQNMITQMSEVLIDVTDGQAQIGTATIHNNAITGANADLIIHPSTNPYWWSAPPGFFRNGGSIGVSIDNILNNSSFGTPGDVLMHEFGHLTFDALDEYLSQPGCTGAVGTATCPVTESGTADCTMHFNGREFCWGHGNSADLTDVTAGNHDPTDNTLQGACRGRSCWDQVVWSWPTTFQKPAAAPDPGTAGAVMDPVNFILTKDNVRVVLVLDQSGSMGLESPSRMERLKVAANDFIATAENGTEVGLVSFASDAETASGNANVPITALGADRSALVNPVNALTPTNNTNIGAGLQKAKEAIVAAGGVTANTYIVLMTDGLNNEPAPDAAAAADLQAKKDDLLASGIPVFVTCTGGDLGLQSQCAEIAAGTNGFNTASASPAQLPKTFVDFQEKVSGHQGVSSVEGSFGKLREQPPPTFFVDEGSESASFSLLWDNANARAVARLVDPNGTTHDTREIPQGRYARIDKPVAGEWKMEVEPGGESGFVASAYVLNRINDLVVSSRWPTRKPGEELYIYAFPQSKGGRISKPDEKLTARVTRPDGTTDTLELTDAGRDASQRGDDIANDGVYTGVYKNTSLKGAYSFAVSGAFDKWPLARQERGGANITSESPRFTREVRVSAAIGEPGDKPTQPEDKKGTFPHLDLCCWLLIITLFFLLVAIVLLWLCWRRKKLAAWKNAKNR